MAINSGAAERPEPTRLTKKRVEMDESQLTPKLAALWRNWNRLYEASAPDLPAKTDLSMAALKTILPDIVLTEAVDADTFTVRIAGTGFEDAAQGSMTGKNALDLTPPQQRNMVASAYRRLLDDRCGLCLAEWIDFQRGVEAHLDTLILPLADNDGMPRFFIAVYDFHDSQYAHDINTDGRSFRHKAFKSVTWIDLSR